MKKLVLLILGFLVFTSSHAAVRGAEISYKQLDADSTIYEITVKLYRYCNAAAITNINSKTKISCVGSSTSDTLSLTLASVKDISSIQGSLVGCNPANSSFAGPGLEEIIFKDTIDFSIAPFSSYYNCSETRISYSECCRTGSINTGPATSNFYTYASLFFSNFEGNTSSTFEERPIFEIPTYVPIHSYNKQGNTDGDSISYDLVNPLTGASSSATYTGTYKKDKPVQVFYPTPLAYPYTNPNASPPIGYYFNSKTGDMIFTASNPGDYSTYTIRATEWRLDTSGTMKKSGITHRELQIETIADPINNLPKFTTLNTTVASCIGELNELNFKVEDLRYTPPPPATPPVLDTLDVVVLCDYPITIELDSQQFLTASNKTVLSGKLTWNTDSFATLPSTFDIFIKVYEKNKYTAYNYAHRKIKVTNYIRPNLSMQLNKIGCGNVEIVPTIDTFNNIPSFITYSVINNLDSIVKSGIVSPSLGKDTILLDTGKYKIQCRSSFALACDSIVEDSVTITNEEVYTFPTETEILACYTVSKDISIDSKWKEARWSTGDTAHSITVTSSGFYSVELEDSCGNIYSHSYLVSFREVQSNQPDTTVCAGSSVIYSINPSNKISWIWPDLTTGFLFSTLDSGVHLLTIYDSLCNYTFKDTFEVFNIYPPIVDIPLTNAMLCLDSSILVEANFNSSYDYTWTNGSDSSSSLITSPGKHYVTASNACGSSTDSILLTQKLPPSIELGNDEVICRGDSVTYSYVNNPDYTYTWNTGATGTSVIAKIENPYVLSASNECGSDIDTAFLYVVDMPTVDLGPDTAINEFDIINVRNRTPSRFASYLWSFGSNADNADLKLEGTYWLKETNVCGSDIDSIVITFKAIGKEELELLGFKVYPNPATNYILIENSTGKPAEVSIRDILGKEIRRTELLSKSTKLDLENISPGKYIVELHQGDNLVSTLIIVQ